MRGTDTVDYILSYFGKETTAAQKIQRICDALINKEYDSPLKETVASTILEEIEFVNEIKDKYLRGKNIDRNLPALKELTKTSIKEIIREVEAVSSPLYIEGNKWGQPHRSL